MAKSYHPGVGTRLINTAFTTLARRGWGKGYLHVLTVDGRTTRIPRSTPVDVIGDGSERWLVAPYGETDWVRNTRAARRVTLSRGGRSQTLYATEIAQRDRVPVLRRYLREVPVTRAYFDTTADSTDEQWAAEAARHPVFRLTTIAPTGD